jgi:hypothetical protein
MVNKWEFRRALQREHGYVLNAKDEERDLERDAAAQWLAKKKYSDPERERINREGLRRRRERKLGNWEGESVRPNPNVPIGWPSDGTRPPWAGDETRPPWED